MRLPARCRSVAFVAGAGVVGGLCLLALLAPLLAPHDPHALSGLPLESPSLAHWLGTNDVGQDVASQLIWGARSSMTLALAAATVATLVGVAVGIGAPLLGGAADTVAMRAVDVFLAIPGLPLLILLVALAGPSRVTMVLAVTSFSWPPIARIVRSQVLTLRSRGFVSAARGFGSGPVYVLRRHLAPAIGPLIGTNFIEVAGVAIFLDAGLAFLGLGDPTTPSWGLMLNRASNYPGLYFSDAWKWWVLPPGLAVTAAVLGLTFMWVGSEARMNPRLATAPPRRTPQGATQ